MENKYSYKSLLAATLCESENSYTVEELFKRFMTPHELLEASEQELMEIRGIGKAKARQIIASLGFAKLLNAPKQDPYIIRSPKDVFLLLQHEIGFAQKEYFVAIFLNTKNHVIGNYETIAIGSLNSCIVHPRELLKACIRRSCASFIIAHNHPSSDCTASKEDLEITDRIAESSKLIGIECLDHIILSGTQFISLKELGHI